MPEPIKLNIDVTKIDKSALFKGAKGTYLNLVLWPSKPNEYGNDYMIKQDLGKDRKGEEAPILGNGKFFQTHRQSAAPEAPAPTVGDSEIPF